MNEDIRFMKMALKEAGKGLGRTSPNRSVFKVVLHPLIHGAGTRMALVKPAIFFIKSRLLLMINTVNEFCQNIRKIHYRCHI